MPLNVELPSIRQLLDLAPDFGIQMSEAEAASYRALIRGPMRSYRRVDELTEFILSVSTPVTLAIAQRRTNNSLRSIATRILLSFGRKSKMATISAKRSGLWEFSWPET